MSRSVYGIDFGTSNIKIFNGLTKTTLNEKDIIAIKNKKNVGKRCECHIFSKFAASCLIRKKRTGSPYLYRVDI